MVRNLDADSESGEHLSAESEKGIVDLKPQPDQISNRDEVSEEKTDTDQFSKVEKASDEGGVTESDIGLIESVEILVS